VAAAAHHPAPGGLVPLGPGAARLPAALAPAHPIEACGDDEQDSAYFRQKDEPVAHNESLHIEYNCAAQYAEVN
jgi:hypothetical protein